MQSTNTSLSTGRVTPSRHTPLRGGKRKRTLLEESEERSSSDYSVTGTARGDIEITEADPQGRFVKLTNKGNKVRWKLKFWRPNDVCILTLYKLIRTSYLM